MIYYMNENTSLTHANWPKQLYFYVVIGVSILFISIASFMLIYSNLTKFVFTKLDDSYVYVDGCDAQTNKPTPVYTHSDNKTDNESKIIYTEEECKTLLTDRKDVEYQRTMLNGILMLIVSGTVFGIHLFIWRKKD